MMVLSVKRVECLGKIAMRMLPGCFPTMGLLPKHDGPRLIFLDAGAMRVRQS
jgi:hypothetical protein